MTTVLVTVGVTLMTPFVLLVGLFLNADRLGRRRDAACRKAMHAYPAPYAKGGDPWLN